MPIRAATTIKKEKNGMLSNEIKARIKIKQVEKIIYFLRISSDKSVEMIRSTLFEKKRINLPTKVLWKNQSLIDVVN